MPEVVRRGQRGADVAGGDSARERAERPLSLAGALAFLAVHEIGVYVDLKVIGAEAEIADEIRRHGLA